MSSGTWQQSLAILRHQADDVAVSVMVYRRISRPRKKSRGISSTTAASNVASFAWRGAGLEAAANPTAPPKRFLRPPPLRCGGGGGKAEGGRENQTKFYKVPLMGDP